MLNYKCSLSCAQEFSKQGKLEEWVHAYLLSDGRNKDFSDGLKLFDRYFIGPLKMSLSLFTRCCGPEENMKWRINEEWFEKHVSDLMEVIKREKDMPPLIVHFLVENGKDCFELNDGNHRLEAYRRLGIEEYYVIVWITEKYEYELFMEKYSNLF
ncbi:MAG: ParB-like nuclease domain-containing protein [Clostridia bacterium]|nr:ParB-like nuclease domain-containing protein [Clostridia bacterium]